MAHYSGNADVLIQGLPANYTEDSLGGFIHEQIAQREPGRLAISLFPLKPGNEYRSARVTFTDAATARHFIQAQNNLPPPGERNRLSVKAYKDKRPKQIGRILDTTSFVVDRCSVHISGLPENVQVDDLFDFFSRHNTEIDVHPRGGNKIYVLKRENGKAMAKITFTDPTGASRCIKRWDGQPFHGMGNHRMWIKLFKDKENQLDRKLEPIVFERHPNRPTTTVKNVVYVRGLPKDIDEGQVMNSFEICGNVRKVVLYRHGDGESQGRGILTFENHAAAQRCIERFNGTTYPGLHKAMILSLFESTKTFNRQLDTIEDDDISVSDDETPSNASDCTSEDDDISVSDDETPSNASDCTSEDDDISVSDDETSSNASDCIVCFETFEENKMIGCVPVTEDFDQDTHYICRDCARRHAEALITDGEVGNGGAGLPCCKNGCSRVILRAHIINLIDNRTANLLDKRMTSVALLGMEGIEYCKQCDYGELIEANTIQVQYFKCQNNKCRTSYCRKCKIDYNKHIGKTCEEVDPNRIRDRARLQREEELSAAVIRICPKCKTQFQKLDGCNKMVCQTCHTTMCYLCRETEITYGHFRNGGPCGQDADSNAYDEARLREVRERHQATGVIQARNQPARNNQNRYGTNFDQPGYFPLEDDYVDWY